MISQPCISHAFILGAGLGTRLRPLTEDIPKPLLHLGGRPLVTYALAHLAQIGVRNVIINTHHAASCWQKAFPKSEHGGIRIAFRYEPELLNTGGGLKNVEDFLAGHGTFLIHNADILTSLPLEKAVAHHHREGNLVTMVLRSTGDPKHVALDAQQQVVDIRGLLGANQPAAYLFTGIHVVEPAIFQHIPRVEVQSIISIYLDLIRRGQRVGGIVLDEGEWSDIGTVAEYERINRLIANSQNITARA